MQATYLIYPMFGLFLITAVVLGLLFMGRKNAVVAGQVDARFYKTYQGDPEPKQLAQISRHFVNLFEAPTLFYVVCILGIVVRVEAVYFHVLAWVYVAFRALHALIHVGQNKIQPRLAVYFASWVVLLAMWISLLIQVGAGG